MARCFLLVRGYGVVACPRRGCSAYAIQRKQWRKDCYFHNLLRVSVEVVRLMVNSSEAHSVSKQQEMLRGVLWEVLSVVLFGGVDATNAGRVVVGFGCIDGGGLIYVACAGAGGSVLSGSSGSQVLCT